MVNDDSVSSLLNCLHYNTIILCRILATGGSLVVSLTVLIVLLVALRKKAWENLPKRVFLGCIIFTAAYAVAALAGIDYTHKLLKRPDDNRLFCEALGLILHYTGTLVATFYVAWPLALLFQVTLPVFSRVCHQFSTASRLFCNRQKVRVAAEVVLFLTVVISPALLITWEPFLTQLPPYGSNGPWCGYRQYIPQNCTDNADLYNNDSLYLSAIPYAIVGVLCWILVLSVALVLCGLWCKFKKLPIGKHIVRSIPTIAMLLIPASVVALWLLVVLALTLVIKHRHEKQSELSWLMHATVNTTANTSILLIVATVYHFPFQKHFKACRRSEEHRTINVCINPDSEATNPPSVWNHRNVPSVTTYSPPDEMSDCRTYSGSEKQVLISRENWCVSYGTELNREPLASFH